MKQMRARILVIHTDRSRSMLLCTAISDTGVECVLAVGEEAGAIALRDGSYALVLLDMGLRDEPTLREEVEHAHAAMIGLGAEGTPWVPGHRVPLVIPGKWEPAEVATLVAAAVPRLVMHAA